MMSLSERHLAELEDAVLVDVGHATATTGSTRCPVGNIQAGNLVERCSHQHVEHLVLDQHRQGRGREVEQEDEEQAPGHRLTRFLHRRRRVVAHQDVRQRGSAHHQAEHQGQEVAPRRCRKVVLGLLVAVRIAREELRMRTGMPASGRARSSSAEALALVQAVLGVGFGPWAGSARAFSAACMLGGRVRWPPSGRRPSFPPQRSCRRPSSGRHVLELGAELIGPGLEGGDDLQSPSGRP